MTWNEAQEFCRRLSDLPQERAAARHYRLPTEAQWEYACRGGSTKPRDGRPTVTGSGANKVVALQPIGSHEPNEFGLHDMRGNAWEWCSDWFHPTYYRRSPELDPQGPASGITRVVRGRDWVFSEFEHCLLTRDPMSPARSSPLVGFRVVCELSVTK